MASRNIKAVLAITCAAACIGCDRSASESELLHKSELVEIAANQNHTVSLRANPDSVIRITAIQYQVDIELQVLVDEGQPIITVNSPLQRNATEFLTISVPDTGLVHIRAVSIDEDYASGSITLAAHILPEVTRNDASLIKAELAFSSAAQSGGKDADWTQRAATYERVASRFLKHGLDARAGDALMRAAMTRYTHLYEWRKSTDLAAQAQEYYSNIGDQWNAALALDLQGAAMIELINEPDANSTAQKIQHDTEPVLRQALQQLNALGDTYNGARVANNIGLMHFYLGNYDQSRIYYERAHTLFASISETKWEAIALQNLLLQDFELRRNVAGAPAHYQQLLSLIDQEKNPDLYVDILNNAALANTVLGELTVAIAQFEQALTMWEDNPSRGRIYAWLALAFLKGGDHERAQLLLETAIPLHEEANDSRDLAASTRLLGNIHRRNGDIADAIAAHERSLAASKSDYRIANARLQLALDHFAARDFVATNRYISEIKAGVDIAATPRIQSGLYLLEARLAMVHNDQEKAVRLIEQTIALAGKVGIWADLYDGYVALADHYEITENTQAMRASLQQAIAILEDVRLSVGSPELRATLVAERGDAYDRLVRSYLAEHAQHEANNSERSSDALRKALGTMQHYRNRVFREQLRNRAGNHKRTTQLASLAARHERLVYEHARKKIATVELAASAEGIAQLAARLAATTDENTASDQPSFVIEQAQSQLLENEVIFSYWLSDNDSWLFVIRNNSVDVLPIANTAAIRRMAVELRALLENPGSRLVNLRRTIAELRDGIVPVGAMLADDKAVFVQSDGILQTIPLQMLLGDHLAVVKVASIYPDTKTATQSGGMTLIVANDSRGSTTPVDATNAKFQGGSYSPLPNVGVEVDALMHLANASTTTLFSDQAAIRERLQQHGGTELKLLHIAAHALANPTMPSLSWIQLADGKLFAVDIEQLRFRADLVVLSACETALGREIPHESVFGLTRSFLVSGSRKVIASLWQVSDRATAEQFTAFYRYYLTEHQDAVTALRNAQAEVRGNRRWRHPYYWSGFELWARDPTATRQGETP